MALSMLVPPSNSSTTVLTFSEEVLVTLVTPFTVPRPASSGAVAVYKRQALAFLGLPGPTFTSSDYFPLAPWFFLFLAGWFFGRLARPRLDGFLPRLACPPLEWVGRHSLGLYLIHQPVCMAVCLLLNI